MSRTRVKLGKSLLKNSIKHKLWNNPSLSRDVCRAMSAHDGIGRLRFRLFRSSTIKLPTCGASAAVFLNYFISLLKPRNKSANSQRTSIAMFFFRETVATRCLHCLNKPRRHSIATTKCFKPCNNYPNFRIKTSSTCKIKTSENTYKNYRLFLFLNCKNLISWGRIFSI